MREIGLGLESGEVGQEGKDGMGWDGMGWDGIVVFLIEMGCSCEGVRFFGQDMG